MASYKEYFERVAYKPQYLIGDRVQGVYNKIPFRGSVGNDTVISLEEGPRVSVHLDLPMRLTEGVKSVIIVAHKDIRPLT
jgi:hypothetical protein